MIDNAAIIANLDGLSRRRPLTEQESRELERALRAEYGDPSDRWSPAEDRMIRKLREWRFVRRGDQTRLTYSDIAEIMAVTVESTRTRNAVAARLRYLEKLQREAGR